MKTIVLAANVAWYLSNFRRNTILKLIESGFHVVLMASRDNFSNRKKIESLGCDFIAVEIDSGGKNPFKDLKTCFEFFMIYRQIKPDVVLNFTPKVNIFSTLAASLLNIPSVNNIAGLGTIFVSGGFTSIIVRTLYKISQSKASRIFFQNEEDKLLFIQQDLVPEHLAERIPGSGVDLEHFFPTSAPDDSIVRFILIGRMLYEKGIQNYVEAARSLKDIYPNTEFYLLGPLDETKPSAIKSSTIDNWVSEQAISYLGFSESVQQEIAKIDCVVLPSYYREGVPRSLLEAAAMGKPIVTTDAIGCRETVDEGINGYLCKPRNSISLTEKLELIVKMSHQERIAMGLAGRKKIEVEFDEKIVIDRYIRVINSILKNRN